MAQTLDGSVREVDSGAVNSLTSAALSCTLSNDIIVVDIYLEDQTGVGAASVTGVTANSGALVFSKQSSVSFHFGVLGNNWVTLERWWVLAPTNVTTAVVANFSNTVDDASMVVYAINGCRTTSPIWDPGANASLSSTGSTSSVPSISGFSTTYDLSMLLMSAASTSNTSSPGVNTAGTSPATFTLTATFVNAANIAWLARANERLIVSSVQSNVSPNFGTAWPDWIMLGDALLDASAVSPSAILQSQACL